MVTGWNCRKRDRTSRRAVRYTVHCRRWEISSRQASTVRWHAHVCGAALETSAEPNATTRSVVHILAFVWITSQLSGAIQIRDTFRYRRYRRNAVTQVNSNQKHQETTTVYTFNSIHSIVFSVVSHAYLRTYSPSSGNSHQHFRILFYECMSDIASV